MLGNLNKNEIIYLNLIYVYLLYLKKIKFYEKRKNVLKALFLGGWTAGTLGFVAVAFLMIFLIGEEVVAVSAIFTLVVQCYLSMISN